MWVGILCSYAKKDERRKENMAVYIFGQVKEYMHAGLDYGQIYRKQILREIACPVRYVYGDILDRNTIEL